MSKQLTTNYVQKQIITVNGKSISTVIKTKYIHFLSQEDLFNKMNKLPIYNIA